LAQRYPTKWAPLPMAEKMQAGAGLGHLMSTLDVLKKYEFEEALGSAVIVREPWA
jgi:aldehyde dehydrogenase (NAD+)